GRPAQPAGRPTSPSPAQVRLGRSCPRGGGGAMIEPDLVETVREAAASLIAHPDGPPQGGRIRPVQIAGEPGRPAAPAPAMAPATAAALPTDEPPPGAPPTDAPPPAEVEENTATRYLCSPSVGTFYRGAEPGARPFVDVDTVVAIGQQVGIVEVMK